MLQIGECISKSIEYHRSRILRHPFSNHFQLLHLSYLLSSVSSGLSTEKKTEIDDLREVAIRRYLKDYTMVCLSST